MGLLDGIRKEMEERKRLKEIEEKEYQRIVKKEREKEAKKRARERAKSGGLIKKIIKEIS